MVIDIAPEQPAGFRAERRRARRGRWLSLHLLLLLTLRRAPREIALFLLCSRATVYAVARDWQQGRALPAPAGARGPLGLTPSLRRSLLALLKKSPAAYGWWRTRWSGATLAWPWQAQRSIAVSAETVRRCLQALDWGWKRAQLVAQDTDPERASKWARICSVFERLGPREALLLADELDLQLRPKVGAPWMPRATQVEVMPPGKNEHRYLAGALDRRTGQGHHCFGFRKLTGLLLDLLNLLDRADPARRFDRI